MPAEFRPCFGCLARVEPEPRTGRGRINTQPAAHSQQPPCMKTHRPFPSALFHVLFAILAVSSSARTADNPTPQGKTQHLTAPDQVPEGLAKSDWGSIRAAYEAGRHAFEPIEGGWQARNPGQQWTTKFDRRGFVTEPKGGGWQWGLELKGYGFPGADVPSSAARRR